MHRSTIALVAGLAALLVLPVPSLAAKPVREAVVADNFTIFGSCAFDVDVEVLANKEIGTAFSDGRVHITGHVVLCLTNAAKPGNSIVLNVSGPAFLDLDDPSIFTGRGTGLSFVEGRLLVTHGPAIFVADETGNETLTLTSASAVDLNARLA